MNIFWFKVTCPSLYNNQTDGIIHLVASDTEANALQIMQLSYPGFNTQGYTTGKYFNTIAEKFHSSDFQTSGDYSNGSVLPPGLRILTCTEYGFPNATTITADISYFIKSTNSMNTAKCRLVRNDGDDILQVIAGSETTTTSTTVQKLTVADVTLVEEKKYYPQLGHSSVITSAQYWGCKLTLKFT